MTEIATFSIKMILKETKMNKGADEERADGKSIIIN